ncbi:MAG: MMPL family transporter [Solirubrobacteraceae bacterium]|nr:MMPL family transporter [Solirubrobacteraceae bacterium]
MSYPWAVLAAWIAIVAVLGVIGLGIDSRLSSSGLQVSGSESSQARALIGGNFGDAATVPVLLSGPRADVKSQGKALVTRLSKRPGVRVISPWSTSSGRSALRPSSDRALVLLSVSGSHDEIARRSASAERVVGEMTAAPVRATVTGMPLLTSEGTRASLSAIHRAELIALPLLLLALLLVFRSPLAAAIPVVFGAATIAASTGALALLADAVRLDAFALAISCMVGLALAVDYSLLFVSRLREELVDGRHDDVESAVGAAAAPTTRTVAAAAAVILVAMAVAAAMSPGTALLAAALGVSIVALLSAATAMVAVPAILVVAGPWLDSGPRTSQDGVSAALARAATQRPALAIGAAVLLLAACIPVLGLRTGSPAAQSLPAGSEARAQYDTVAQAMGAGWTEPFEIVAVARRGAITTPDRLATLERAQRKLSRDPDVRAVLGPGTIARSAEKLRSAGRRAVAAGESAPRRAEGRLRGLDRNVSSAADGVESLRDSLSGANAAASKLQAGSRDVTGGVGSLRNGLDGAGSGARQLAAKLADAGRGTSGLASQSAAASGGARRVRDGARELGTALSTLASSARDLQSRLRARADSLNRVQSGVRAQRRQADDALAAAERAIPMTSASGIRARAALRQARQALSGDAGAGLDDPIRQLGLDAQYAGKIAAAMPASDAGRLATAVGGLADSADAIARKVKELGGSVGSLSKGSDSLVSALAQLDGGADKIGAAVSAVTSGVDGLASGVRSGEQRSGELAKGLNDAGSAVRGLSGSGDGKDPQPQKATASFFDSGYFLLAALESGNGDAPFGVNVDKGGQGARIVVVPRHPASDPRTQALYERLQALSGRLGKKLGADAAVGGPAAVLSDYDSAAAGRLPLIVLVLTLVTALLLAVLLRSIVVACIGVALNLLAVGATLGLLALLFQGEAPLLGGPGEIDAVAVTAIFGVVFALSIDYQVFIVSRVREEWLRTGDAAQAVQVGLARTARVVTGAALSMLGVFLAFGLSDIASLRQFGVGLAIAIVIDATLVRLVLLPAALHLAGRAAWWTPNLAFEDPAPLPANLAWEAPARAD